VSERQKVNVLVARRAKIPRPVKQRATSQRIGHLIKVAVRSKPLELVTLFEHRSSSISRLEAQLEDEEAARMAGYSLIGHVIEIP
jgi:hypothetical protein